MFGHAKEGDGKIASSGAGGQYQRKRYFVDQREGGEKEDAGRLTFPQIWVESVCESSEEDEEECARLRRPQPVLRSLLATCTSTDVSFETNSTSSRQSSLQFSSRENSTELNDQERPCQKNADVEEAQMVAYEGRNSSSASIDSSSPSESPTSSLSQPQWPQSQSTLPEREATDGRERSEAVLDDFRTPVESLVEEWLRLVEVKGFPHPTPEAAEEDEDDEDDDDEADENEDKGALGEGFRVFDLCHRLRPEDVAEVLEGRVSKATGEPAGQCLVRLRNGDELMSTFGPGLRRRGRASIEGANLASRGLVCLRGHCDSVDGSLKGPGQAVLAAGSFWQRSPPGRITLHGSFEGGFMEGAVRGLDERGGLAFAGAFARGLPTGFCWLAHGNDEGHGWLHGEVDASGRFSGPAIAYVYPDLTTALLGDFEEECMVSARAAKIESASVSAAGILQLHIVNKESGEKNRPPFSRCPSDNDVVRCDWLLADPYESVTVVCAPSRINGAGDGLFAAKDLPAGRVIAYYNGVRVEPGQKYSANNCDYQIYVDWGDTDRSAFVDVPQKCADAGVYHASLAHKANHSFQPNCRFVPVEHPRFGRIPALFTLEAVPAGMELFAHYKYDTALAPRWYLEAWAASSRAVNGHSSDGDSSC